MERVWRVMRWARGRIDCMAGKRMAEKEDSALASMQRKMAGVCHVPQDWRWWHALTHVRLSPLSPFPFSSFANSASPLCDEEFLHYAATFHAIKQGLTFGLPLVLIFFCELCILFMVSLPFDDEASTFGYEVQFNNIYVSQLFDQLYEAHPWGSPAIQADVLTVVPHVNRSIPIRQLSDTMHDTIPKSLYLLKQHANALAKEGKLTAEERERLGVLHAGIAGHYGQVLYTNLPVEETAAYLQVDVSAVLHARQQPPSFLRDWGHGAVYPKARSQFLDEEPGTVLLHMRKAEQLQTQAAQVLRKAASRRTQDHLAEAQAELQKMQHVQWLYQAAVHNHTLGTLFLSQVRDVGQSVLSSVFSSNGQLIDFFKERPWFDFQFSIYGVFVLTFYLYFRSEAFRYPHRHSSSAHPSLSRKPGFLRFRVRHLYPLVVLLTHFTISLGLLRLVRVLTYSGTLLPPNRVWCKPHRFRGTDKFGHLLTMSTPFLERFSIVLYYVVSTYGQKVGGGCADLIYSGHVTIYVLAVVIFHNYCPHWWATAVMYVLFLEPTLHAIIKGHHYTVDCVVATYMSFLVAYFVQNSILPRIFGEEVMAETYRLKSMANDRRTLALPA